MNLCRLILLAGLLGGSVTPLALAENSGEEIVLDQQTGDYRIRFLSATATGDMTLVEGIFYPSTKIDPVVRSKFRALSDGLIAYRYYVRNKKTSKQDIEQLILHVSAASSDERTNPPSWSSSIAPGDDVNQIVSWSSRLYRYEIGEVTDMTDRRWREPALRGISPGGKPVTFGVKSRDLPGIGLIQHVGAAATTMLPGEGPNPESEVGKRLAELEAKNFVPRLAAAPRIPVPTPFDAGTVLANIRTHINNDMVPMQLIDPVFANELNRLFTAAIEAAKHNNDKGVKENLKDIRKALKKAHRDMGTDDEDDHARKHRHGNKDDSDDWEHTDPKQKPKPAFIDKLAARVLDFDVKYVLGRLGDK